MKRGSPRKRNEERNKSTRQLFDPRSDNPLAFNKPSLELKQMNKAEKEEEEERVVERPKRTLWNVNDKPVKLDRRELKSVQETISPAIVKRPEQPTVTTAAVTTTTTTITTTTPKKKVHKERDDQKDEQRKQLKSLISSIRTIETKLEALTLTSRSLPCFQDQEKTIPNRRNHHTLPDQPITPVLVQQDLIDIENVWRQKIELHTLLAQKYLEILKCDLEYAEKKGLETLCWKRAVYSLVDQFRKALKISTAAAEAASASSTSSTTNTAPVSELAALLMDEEDEKEDELVPVIQPGGGMTFVKVEKQSEEENPLAIKQTKIILTLFLEYLDKCDAFYQTVTLFLKTKEEMDDESIEAGLKRWRRTNKFKWYSCIPIRGDIARYRLSYTPDTTESIKTTWTKKTAFEVAWKWYYLGIWLMPAKGNLYFNLSLVLQQFEITPGNEFHKLYLSTRSLMVRRNGFLNARESMLVLFEGNRRWIDQKLFGETKKKMANKRPNRKQLNKEENGISMLIMDRNEVIPALFVRLHGMLFTKIELDEFPKIKRLYFNHLFERQDKPASIIIDDGKKYENDPKLFSTSHQFWLETIILCLSSLYTYDYSHSKLTQLISLNSTKVFYPDKFEEKAYQTLLEQVGESLLFGYEIDLTCQIAVELLQRYLDPLLPVVKAPSLPSLPHVILQFQEEKSFLFDTTTSDDNQEKPTLDQKEEPDQDAWLIYIEILLHWIVLNGICIRTKDNESLWESLIGDIGYDLVSYQDRFSNKDDDDNQSSKISSAFWPLLLSFLNKLLNELPEEEKYDMVNKHFMQDEEEMTDDEHTSFSEPEYEFAKTISIILGQAPDLPEENCLRGLGWVDEIHGRFLKLEQFQPQNVQQQQQQQEKNKFDTVMRRKMKILDYGFTLVKHLNDILYYDPVEELFTVSKSVQERVNLLDGDRNMTDTHQQVEEEEIQTTIAEMDDDVLLSNETEYFDDEQGDDIMTQLKKRREQLQSIVASAEQEARFGFRRLPARAKEREVRLNYLRERIIPGKTVLVLDTNCFIGHLDLIRKLLECKKWSIIVPLVVITELDGLRTNPQRLGLVAEQSIELIQKTLAEKSNKQLLRIQTSHNNFMNDISIRSEQFVFGETDRNLDDLVLSACLWWSTQQQQQQALKDQKTISVCLVTGDRNLSVKARARDVEVVPVSAITQLTPK